MKKLKPFLGLILLLTSQSLFGQCHYPINDKIQKFHAEVCFISRDTGWRFFTNGEIYSTHDGGENWTLLSDLSNEPVYGKLNFIHRDTGFILSTEGFFWTNDGGNSWSQNNHAKYKETYYDGIGGLYYIDGYNIVFSDDHFETIKKYNYGTNIQDLKFHTNGNGFFITKTGEVYKIENQIPESNPRFQFMQVAPQSLQFFNDQEGILVDDSLNLYRTIDGGYTWDWEQKILDTLPNNPGRFSFHFLPNSPIGGISYNYARKIIKTFDKGRTWEIDEGPNVSFYPINLCKDGTIWLHKEYGYAYRGINAFQLDEFVEYPFTGLFEDIGFFTDSIWLFLTGEELYKSNDAGNSISVIESSISLIPRSISVINETDVLMINTKGVVYLSQDQGESWEEIYNFKDHFNHRFDSGFKFIDESTGYIVLNEELLIRTLDGGYTWEALTGLPGHVSPLYATYGKDKIAAIGDNKLFISDDKGDTWEPHPLEWPHSSVRMVWKSDTTLLVSYNYRGFFEYNRYTRDSSHVIKYENSFNWNSILLVQNSLFFVGNGGRNLLYAPGNHTTPILIPYPEEADYVISNLIESPFGDILIPGWRGYLGKVNLDPPICNLELQNYLQDSILNPDQPLKWDNPETCYQNSIISIGNYQDQYNLIKDSIIGITNEFGNFHSLNDQADLYFKIGVVSLHDTIYCLEKHLINTDCTIEIPLDLSYCQTGGVYFRGVLYYRGTHDITIENPSGCDSLFLLTVREISPQYGFNIFNICEGESIRVGQDTFNTSQGINTTIHSEIGCDSIKQDLMVILDPSNQNYFDAYITPGLGSLYSLTFLHDTLGWATTRGFEDLHFTHNGGKTWTQINSFPDKDIIKINFISPTIGWILFQDNQLGKTFDGGHSWEFSQLTTSSNANNIEFVTPQVGYIVCNAGIILKTIDSGDSWSEIQTDESKDLTGLWFFDESLGFIYGKSGSLQLTSDGGQNWERQFPYLNDILGVSFFNKDTGFLIVSSTLFSTTDGGDNWEIVPNINVFNNKFVTTLSNQEVILYNDQSILVSEDLGRTWKEIILPNRVRSKGPFSDNKSNVWFKLDNGYLLHYKPKSLLCVNEIIAPEDTSHLISVNQTFSWLPVKPCVEGFNIQLGKDNSLDNLVTTRDIGYQTQFTHNNFLPFDTDINLSIFPYIEDNQNNTCPPLTFHTCPFIGDSVKVEICYGESFEFRGNTYTDDTQVFWGWSLPNGCDSFIVLDLKVRNPDFTSIDTTVSPGDVFQGITLQQDTSYQQLYTNQFGCDSLVTYTIHVDRSSVKNNLLLPGLKVFPNPTSGKLLFQIPGSDPGAIELLISNQLGQNIQLFSIDKLMDNRFEITFPQSLADGIYYLKIRTDRGFYMEKATLYRN
ncbi:MAG: T9SS type A sorting domain-containing protein [Saprospiraceae bacterium]|nr:T9SS type A sorting domain-containing protein [Saprospiraceae bacterium]